MKRYLPLVLTLALGVGLSAVLPAIAADDANSPVAIGMCGTQIRFEQELRAMGIDPNGAASACPIYGPCDEPETRDLWTPAAGGPATTIRLAMHVVAHSDGSYPFATAAEIGDAVDSLNFHYRNLNIQFEYTLDEIHSDDWRVLDETEIDAMKIATAADPTQYLNVWMTTVLFGYSFGTFPFSDNALDATGGVILSQGYLGGNYSGLSHEIGHCLGLWHNFHGVTEVTKCGPCYEAVDAADRDLLGDLCADTPPAPSYYQCGDAPGTDSCSGLAWGYTQPENIMGYAPTNCRTLLTPQQGARMRCWIDDALSGWVAPPVGTCCEDRVGDANGSGQDEPTIGDVSVMIDALFIVGNWAVIPCLAEADINLSSASQHPTPSDISVGDVSYLIDYLFIGGSELGLPDCF